MRQSRWQNFEEFWPFYLAEHSHPKNRLLHVVGTSIALVIFGIAIWQLSAGGILLALCCGYGAAWIGHFVIEKNRPATFKAPLYSLRADFRLWQRTLLRKPMLDPTSPDVKRSNPKD